MSNDSVPGVFRDVSGRHAGDANDDADRNSLQRECRSALVDQR
jgi:hypothetical protein